MNTERKGEIDLPLYDIHNKKLKVRQGNRQERKGYRF